MSGLARASVLGGLQDFAALALVWRLLAWSSGGDRAGFEGGRTRARRGGGESALLSAWRNCAMPSLGGTLPRSLSDLALNGAEVYFGCLEFGR